MKTKWEFDERQLQIRGKVYFHGFVTALILLLLNAFLQDMGVVWASGYNQNFLIVMLTITVTGIESILRGAYFVRGKSRNMIIGLFAFLSLVLIAFNIKHLIRGEALITGGVLTDNGFSLALAIMFTLLTIVAIAKEIVERREISE